MGFLMVNGLSRVDFHWGYPYKQLPALKQSLAKAVVSNHLGATRYQALSKKIANTVLGIFCSSFLLIPHTAHAQTINASAVPQIVNQAPKLLNPTPTQSSTPISSPSPIATPAPQPPSANFQLPHTGYVTTTYSAYHPGIDICIGLGMPIKPISKGVVTEAGYNVWGLGLMVEIDHGNGYKSIYGHMGKIYVTKGKEVDVNDLLGEVGMTGHTTGPHTHLEISYSGKKVDPRPLLPELRNYPKEEDFITYQSATPSAIAIPSYDEASTSANVFTGIVEKTASSSSSLEENKTESEETKLTAEKISENNVKSLVSLQNNEDKNDPLSLQLTDQLPQTLANYSIPSNLAGENFKNILSLSIHQSRNAEDKQKFESIAQENLSTILNKSQQDLQTFNFISESQTNQKPPVGGRVSFDFLSLISLK